MSKFKVGDEVCWRSTKDRAVVKEISALGMIKVSDSGCFWSEFFFSSVVDPNNIMKGLVSDMKLMFSKASEDAKLPTKAYESDAGHDLYANDEMVIEPGSVAKIPTGVMCAIPAGYYGKIDDRSSMALKGMKCLGGVIDCGFRSEVSVIMTNLSRLPFVIISGDKIAQLIIHKIYDGEVEMVDKSDLPAAERGNRGFGSSGK